MGSLFIVTPLLQLQTSGALDKAFGSDIVQMIFHAGLMVKFVLLILFLFSVLSWTIIFMKWRLLGRARQETNFFLDLFWEGTDFNKIYQQSTDLGFSPVAQLFKSGYIEFKRFQRIHESSAPAKGEQVIPPLVDNLERAMRRTAIAQNNRLEKALSFLATTGNTTPFIGLFGTVWGIMEAFRGIGLKGSASLAVVAPGISEALIATAAGLAAAIPAVVAYNYFNRKAMVLESEMDSFTSDFLSLVERQFFRRQIVSKSE